MEDIADNPDLQPLHAPLFLPDRKQVQKSLGRVFMGAVPCVDHGGLQAARQQVATSWSGVAHDEDIHPHRLDVARHVFQGLPL